MLVPSSILVSLAGLSGNFIGESRRACNAGDGYPIDNWPQTNLTTIALAIKTSLEKRAIASSNAFRICIGPLPRVYLLSRLVLCDVLGYDSATKESEGRGLGVRCPCTARVQYNILWPVGGGGFVVYTLPYSYLFLVLFSHYRSPSYYYYYYHHHRYYCMYTCIYYYNITSLAPHCVTATVTAVMLYYYCCC